MIGVKLGLNYKQIFPKSKDHFFTQNRVQKWSFLMNCFKL